MNEKQVENPVCSHDTLEFVTVAVEFCAFLENSQGREKKDFVETLLKLLPLLYLKAVLLPRVESNGDFLPPDRITEQEYDFIRHIIFDILRKDDEYEELVCDQDMQTDVSQWKSISENLADMYQALRNFLYVYQQGIEDCMHDAIWALNDNFELYWGQNLVDSLKRLHYLCYSGNPIGDDDEDNIQ